MKTVIMAGGKGTRIKELFGDVPKPLIQLNGKPVLWHTIQRLKENGLTDVIITVGYLADQIMDYFGDGRNMGVKIRYFVEDQPLGNAGALLKIRKELSDDFLLINGDIIFDVDFNRIIDYHRSCESLITLYTHPNTHPYDSTVIIADSNNRVMQWIAKEDQRPTYYRNRVNAGIHILNPTVLEKNSKETDSLDLDRDIIRPAISSGYVYCYDGAEYIKDMGTPERYREVNRDFETGRIKCKNRHNSQKAIFLDRDGTINEYRGFITKTDDFVLLPDVCKAIQLINRSGLLAIVVTNQPVVARGEATEKDLNDIHNKMETLLGQEGAYVDAIYYCPHHPDKGFEGEVPALKVDCDCRKPKPGMLLKAAVDWNIDLDSSWMIGDGERDIMAGNAAGCLTVLLTDEDSTEQTYVAKNLFEAVCMILEREENE